MTINNNMNGMLAAQMELAQNAKNIASIAATVGSPELAEVSQDLTSSIVEQIPIVVAYEANAQGIKTQEAMMNTLLDIKA